MGGSGVNDNPYSFVCPSGNYLSGIEWSQGSEWDSIQGYWCKPGNQIDNPDLGVFTPQQIGYVQGGGTPTDFKCQQGSLLDGYNVGYDPNGNIHHVNFTEGYRLGVPPGQKTFLAKTDTLSNEVFFPVLDHYHPGLREQGPLGWYMFFFRGTYNQFIKNINVSLFSIPGSFFSIRDGVTLTYALSGGICSYPVCEPIYIIPSPPTVVTVT